MLFEKRGTRALTLLLRNKILSTSKRSQMKLSFGMIFSIILIVIFIAFAIYAILKFLDISNSAQIATFTDNLQGDIDKIWRGSQGSQKEGYFLPSKIDYVCFMDTSSGRGTGENREFYDEFELYSSEGENLFFYPINSAGNLNSKEMKHIDVEKTTETDNPLCIENEKGKIELILKKNFGESSVTVTK